MLRDVQATLQSISITGLLHSTQSNPMNTPACPSSARPRRRWSRAALLALGAIFCVPQALHAAPDREKVQGPLACGECHKSEIEAWKTTKHFETLNKMHREPRAKEIADKLGIRRIKSEAICLDCHYTTKMTEGKPEVIAGISCESCHGAAQGWIKIHSDFGGSGAKKENETPEHRKERMAKSIAGGQIRPSDTYSVAANCFSCHTVPQENIVNAGHPAGSDFDLIAWSQGEVRHNFTADLKKNAEPKPEHKRMLFILGRVLDADYSLRAAAKATKEGLFVTAMAQRVKTAIANLQQVQQATGSPELQEIIAAASSAEPKLNNGAALTAAADKISSVARSFAAANDGSKFAAVDALLPAPDKYKGKSFQP